jgi:predicted CXXCH cytochrome family protein
MKRRLLLISLILVPLGGVLVFKQSGAEAAMLLNPRHECTFCHSLHGGSNGEVPLGANAQTEALCLSCHHPDNASTAGVRGDGLPEPADVHTNDPTGNSCCTPFRVTCTECHEVHSNAINRRGNENLMLVKAAITSPRDPTQTRDVVFESRSVDAGQPTLYSFCDDDEDNNGIWDQVCDVCHGDPNLSGDIGRHWWDGSTNHHQNGATCTRCHTHGNSLSP